MSLVVGLICCFMVFYIRGYVRGRQTVTQPPFSAPLAAQPVLPTRSATLKDYFFQEISHKYVKLRKIDT